MTQSRRMSAVEAIVTVAVGMLMAFTGQVTVFPLIGLQATLSQTLSSVFTALSLIRSDLLCRAVMRIGRRKG